MFNVLRIVLATTTLLPGAVAAHEASAALPTPATTTTPAANPAIEIVGMTHAEETATLRSVALFAEAGLTLPPVVIRRHHDTAGCNDHDGLHRVDAQRSVIDVCTDDGGDGEQRTIIHELGHAWSFHAMTPEDKEAFRAARGWQFWLDYDHAGWADNGAEQAAEIVVWALSEQPVEVRLQHRTSCTELHTGYVALTGLAPLHGHTERCDDTEASRVS